MTSSRLQKDKDLAARAKVGETLAFETLYRVHVSRVYTHAVYLVGRDGAEEVVQDAFFRAWQKIDTWRGDASFGSWVSGISTRIGLDYLRRKQGSLVVLEDGHLSTPAKDTDDASELAKAIAGLPIRTRTVFLLHEVEGLEHQEVAVLLGINVGTSKSQLHRARRLLRTTLMKNDEV